MDIYTVEYNGVTYAGFSAAGLAAAGVPQSVLSAANAAERRELIKFECRRRIYGICSSEAQLNISGAATVISAKAPESRTADEEAFMTTYAASLAWIAAMRASVEALSADADADFSANASWPVCPPEVLALVALY